MILIKSELANPIARNGRIFGQRKELSEVYADKDNHKANEQMQHCLMENLAKTWLEPTVKRLIAEQDLEQLKQVKEMWNDKLHIRLESYDLFYADTVFKATLKKFIKKDLQ